VIDFGDSVTIFPLLSLVKKDGFEYGDGGLGCVVPLGRQLEGELQRLDAYNLGNPEIIC